MTENLIERLKQAACDADMDTAILLDAAAEALEKAPPGTPRTIGRGDVIPAREIDGKLYIDAADLDSLIPRPIAWEPQIVVDAGLNWWAVELLVESVKRSPLPQVLGRFSVIHKGIRVTVEEVVVDG